jgi:hypothetical protein
MLNAVVLCRVLISLLGSVVWGLFYMRGRWAYRLPHGWRKDVSETSLGLGAVGIFVLQVNLMSRLSPGDAHGIYFHCFIIIEGGGALALMFYTLYRERAKSRSVAPVASVSGGGCGATPWNGGRR